MFFKILVFLARNLGQPLLINDTILLGNQSGLIVFTSLDALQFPDTILSFLDGRLPIGIQSLSSNRILNS